MNMRKKTILIIGTIIILFICALLVSLYFNLRGGFNRAEEQTARHAVNEASVAFNNDVLDIADLANQLALDNGTRTFMQNLNSNHLKKSILDFLMQRQKVTFVLIVNKKGQVTYGNGYDRMKKIQVPVSPALMEIITPQSILLKHSSIKSLLSGIIILQDKPFVIAAKPILDGKSPEKISGTIILAQLIDSSEKSRPTGATVSILPIKKHDTPADLRRIVESISADNPIAIKSSYQEIAGYKLVNDVFGLPALLIKAALPRLINPQNNALLNFPFLGLVIIITAAFALLFFILIDRMILTRLNNISQQIRSIVASGHYKGRIAIDSKDELTAMGYSINFLLIKLDQTEKALCEMSQIYKCITENMLDVIFQTDLQGVYQYISPSHKSILGHDAEKLSGKSFFDLIHPQDIKNVYELFGRHIRERISLKFECRIHHSAGYYVWLKIVANPIFDEEGNLSGSVMVAREITDSKES